MKKKPKPKRVIREHTHLIHTFVEDIVAQHHVEKRPVFIKAMGYMEKTYA